jgi:anti-sigma B factor antagonist
MAEMRVAKYMRGTVTVVELSGELDSGTAPRGREQLVELVAHGGRVLLDLGQLTYMSSAGLRVMLLIYRESARAGTQVGLTGIRPEIESIMSATGFLHFFTVTATLEEGLEEMDG